MEKLTDNLKKVILAGIGAVAITAEKSKDVLDDMVKKGELTVEQGKVLNEELKHNLKQTVKNNVNVKVKVTTPEELSELLDKMTPEQLEALKAQIKEKESTVDSEAEEVDADDTAEDDVEDVEVVEEEKKEAEQGNPFDLNLSEKLLKSSFSIFLRKEIVSFPLLSICK